MIFKDNRGNERYDLFGMDLVCEYAYISEVCDPVSELDSPDDAQREYHSAVVHNISRGGICISVEDQDLDVGKEIELFLTAVDPASGMGNHYMEIIAQVIWVSEEPNGFRAGLTLTDVPEDFLSVFEEIVKTLEKNHLTR